MSNEDFTADLTTLRFKAAGKASIFTALAIKIRATQSKSYNVETSIQWGTILRFPASEEPQEEMFLYLFDL